MARRPAQKSAAKKAAPRKSAARPPASTGGSRSAPGGDAPVAENDRITSIFRDMLTPAQRGTDRFLDVVTWNIKWFNVQNPERVAHIARIMGEINGDVFILQEIEQGSMEPVVAALNAVGAGNYKTFYGSNGGDQRVTFVYDQATVRATSNPVNLFADDRPLVPGTRKDVFPRFPVQMKVSVYATRAAERQGRILAPFDFELVGVHLKSQRQDRQGDDGTLQRRLAAEMLTGWMKVDADDQDVIVAGDWNAAADRPEFASVRELERTGAAHFASFNPADEASHFFKSGRSSRLDYIVLSAGSRRAAANDRSEVLLWRDIKEAATAVERRDALARIYDEVSDHLPVVARFYFFDEDR